MAPKIDDRWAWLGFGIFLFFAAKGIRYAIKDLVRLSEIDPYQFEPKDKDQRLEDNIPLETLRTLSSSPNPNIANSAKQIIVSRLLRDKTAYRSIIADSKSTDPFLQKRAKIALEYLSDERFQWEDGNFRGLPYMPADSPDNDENDDESLPSPIDVSGLMGLSRVFADMMDRENEWVDSGSVIVPSARNPVAGWVDIPRERDSNANDGEGEAERRRRRREAVVVHEGGGAIVEGDILVPSLQSAR